MRVDVVVSCHDQEGILLLRCNMSLIGQTVNRGRILVIPREPEWETLPQKLNAGLDRVETDYFIPMAADDKLDPTFIEKTTAALTHDVAAVYTDIQRFGDEECVNESPEWPVDDLMQQNRLPGTALFHTETVRLLGGYNEEDLGWCDWGLWIELARQGAKCVRVPEPLLLYRRHAGNASANRTPEEEAEMYERIRRNHGI